MITAAAIYRDDFDGNLFRLMDLIEGQFLLTIIIII